jgi:DNA (cytosine-5)-methyltransferase 1
MLALGSLCSGYGGLDLAAQAILGPLRHAWHAETDPGAATVLAHHWPDVPNLGDLTAVDWTAVPPVDVLTAGYPCQPLSFAGRRAGMTDERWIWGDVFAAIRVLRPRIVLLENVAGHLSLGFGRVLGDLASAGFDAEWGCFRASEVGAPHRRERVFVAAWPAADAHEGGRGTPIGNLLPGQPDAHRSAAADPSGVGRAGGRRKGSGRRCRRWCWSRRRSPPAHAAHQRRTGCQHARDRRPGPAYRDLPAADAAGARPQGPRSEPAWR